MTFYSVAEHAINLVINEYGNVKNLNRYERIDFHSVMERVLCHPQEASDSDKFDRNLLHLLSQCHSPACPIELMQNVYEAHPEAATKQQKWRWTPLHFAARRSSDEIVHFLSMKAPEAITMQDDTGRTPLHNACYYERLDLVMILVKACPQSVFIEEGNGISPLDIILTNYAHQIVVKNALYHCNFIPNLELSEDTRNFRTANFKVKNGKFPPNIYGGSLEILTEVADASAKSNMGVDPLTNDAFTDSKCRIENDPIDPLFILQGKMSSENFASLQIFWQTVCYLVRIIDSKEATIGALSEEENKELQDWFDTEWCLLHAFLGMSKRILPSNLIFLAMKLCPEQLSRMDINKCFPLHMVAKNKFMRDEKITSSIIKAYPDGIRKVAKSGHLPLHLACKFGKQWNEGVETIVNAYPDALRVCHGVTGFFPYMSAATSNVDLNTLYCLVRHDPTVLQHK